MADLSCPSTRNELPCEFEYKKTVLTAEDKYNFLRIICLILGVGTLLPWSFFITAIPYFQSRLSGSNSSTPGSQRDDYNFSNWMTLLAQLPLLLCTLLNSFIYRRVAEKIRIAGSMLVILGLFVFTASLVKTELSPQIFFGLTMATVWLINSFCAILQGSLFGLLTLFPQKYNSAFLSGQGMAGIFAALVMILSMSVGFKQETVALCYFITPCIGTCVSIICYLALPRPNFSSLDDMIPYRRGEPKQNVSIRVILRKIRTTALAVVVTFTVTLAVYPAITAKVRTSYKDAEKWDRFFTPVCCFLLFNVADWIGRSVTAKTLWPGPNCEYIPLMAAGRCGFIPLFMLCNIDGRYYLTSFFQNDAWFIVFMVFFSLTNGYFVSLLMCLAPQKVEPHERETAGALMTFFIATGLSSGAGLSFAFKELL